MVCPFNNIQRVDYSSKTGLSYNKNTQTEKKERKKNIGGEKNVKTMNEKIFGGKKWTFQQNLVQNERF